MASSQTLDAGYVVADIVNAGLQAVLQELLHALTRALQAVGPSPAPDVGFDSNVSQPESYVFLTSAPSFHKGFNPLRNASRHP
jgi:hypothetical protein